MNTREYARICSQLTARSFDGGSVRFRVIALRHFGWLDGKKWGVFADLRSASLSRSDLSEANLSGANLSGANLSGANLIGASLSRSNLIGASLSGSNLSGAKYTHKGIEARRFTVFLGLYKYTVIPIIDVDGVEHIAMGCKFQTREQWALNFWNNDNEFPDDGSEKTELRKFALATACAWLDAIKGVK